MAYLEEFLMPRIYAALKEIGHPLTEEIERVMGYQTDTERERAIAEAQHSAEQAEAAGTPISVSIKDAKAAAKQVPDDASWTEVAAQAKADGPSVNIIH